MLWHRLTEQTGKVWILSRRLIMQKGMEKESAGYMGESFCLLSSWIFQTHAPPEAVMFTCDGTRCSERKWLSTPPWHTCRQNEMGKENKGTWTQSASLERRKHILYVWSDRKRSQRCNEKDIALHEGWELAKLMSSIYSSLPPEHLPPLHMRIHTINNPSYPEWDHAEAHIQTILFLGDLVLKKLRISCTMKTSQRL